MALSENKVSVQNFVGGLVTDYHELNTPQNICVDEQNCDLNIKGFRQRRLGIAYESGYIQNPNTLSIANASTAYIDTYPWVNVNNNANLNFVAVQFGNMLYFYDTSYQPVSAGILSFTINLDTYAAPGVTSTADTAISVDSGYGYLWVAGAKINPFYVTYTASGGITVSPITIQIRDLVEQDNTLANDARLATITDKRKYDLFNQGWNQFQMSCYYDSVGPYINIGKSGNQNESVFQYYLQTEGVYPPKNAPWWVGKRIGDKGVEVFDPVQYDTVVAGTTLAGLGRYIVNAFAKDRAGVSGIGSLGIEINNNRPTAIAFYSGHVFYALGNTVYFSQLITDDPTLSGKCYQQNDPTAEQLNNLVATDGGTILIPQSSNPLAFFRIENSLILFTTNGMFILGGNTIGAGFSATEFSVNRISDVPCVSARTIVNADGIPYWWSPSGIYTIESIQTKQSFNIKNISLKKVQTFYNNIVPLARINAKGCYDHITKRISWLYNGSSSVNSTTNRFYYNNILNLDLIFDAFFPYTIVDQLNSQPSKLAGVFNINPIFTSTSTTDVTDHTGTNVTDQYGALVTVNALSYANTQLITSDVIYLAIGPTPIEAPTGTSPLAFSFANFTGTNFLDWSDVTSTIGLIVDDDNFTVTDQNGQPLYINTNAGANYSSYLNCYYTISGYMTPHFTPAYDAMMWMYSPYIYVFLENENRVTTTSTSTTTYVPTVTSASIMGYVGGGTVTFDVNGVYPDLVNKNLYLFSTGTGATKGISQFDGLNTGSPLLEKTLSAIGTPNGISPSEAFALLHNGHITYVDSGSSNSDPIDDIIASTLSFNRQFGISSGSLAQSTNTRVLSVGSMCPIRYGTTEGTVMGTIVGNEIDFIDQATFTNTFLTTTPRVNNYCCQGAVTPSQGTAYVTSVPTGFSTNPTTLYQVTYSAIGPAVTLIGTVSPAQIDVTWTHAQCSAPAYDHTDGNIIIQAGTSDAVTNQNYFVKINAATAAVMWTCVVSALDTYSSTDMPLHNIVNQTLFHLVTNKLYTINTATGIATSQPILNLTVSGSVISDDITNSIIFRGTYAYSSGPVPTYLGAYMGTGGHHTLTNQWGRWFVGTVAGQTQTTTTTGVPVVGSAGSSCLLQTAWDFSSSVASHKWSQQIETFKYRNNFFVATSRNKVRGKGKTLQLRFSSTEGKDFQLLGWGIWYSKNAHP